MKMYVIQIILFSLSSLFTGLIARNAKFLGLLDVPNERSAHVQLTPRGGGLAILAVWALSLFFLSPGGHTMAMVASGILVGTIGFLDDLKSVLPVLRLTVHIIASSLFARVVGANLGIDGLSELALVVLLTWSINTFNFMDGINGIAGFQALLLSVSLGIMEISSKTGNGIATLSLGVATCGFLLWNFPRARIFMGDVGSGFLGFAVLALFCIWDGENILTRLCYFFSLHGIFVIDSTCTLVRRVLSGEKWWSAHKQHAYQRLVHVRGWSHAKVVGLIMGFNALLFICVLLAFLGNVSRELMLSVCISISFGYYLLVEFLAPFSSSQQAKPISYP